MSNTVILSLVCVCFVAIILYLLWKIRRSRLATAALLHAQQEELTVKADQHAQEKALADETFRQQLARYQVIVDVETERERIQVATQAEKAQVLTALEQARQ